jgi:PTH1 family peptidyl-tRNA hydrolase
LHPYIKQISLNNIIIVHDELSLAVPSVKYKLGGSAKGHNGLKSLIAYLGSEQFARIRVGIGRPESRE